MVRNDDPEHVGSSYTVKYSHRIRSINEDLDRLPNIEAVYYLCKPIFLLPLTSKCG